MCVSQPSKVVQTCPQNACAKVTDKVEYVESWVGELCFPPLETKRQESNPYSKELRNQKKAANFGHVIFFFCKEWKHATRKKMELFSMNGHAAQKSHTSVTQSPLIPIKLPYVNKKTNAPSSSRPRASRFTSSDSSDVIFPASVKK